MKNHMFTKSARHSVLRKRKFIGTISKREDDTPKKQRILRRQLCNDEWICVLQYCDLETLVSLCATKKSLYEAITENKMDKKWDSKEEAKRVIKNQNYLLFECFCFSNWPMDPFETLNYASLCDNLNIVKFNIRHLEIINNNIKPYLQDVFCNALKGKSSKVIQFLLQDERLELNNYIFHCACAYRHLEMVKFLLKDPRINPGDCNNAAIQRSSEYGFSEIVQVLLQDPRVDPTDNNNQAISNASSNGHIDTVEILLQDGRANPGARKNWFIIHASSYGNDKIVELLLKHPNVDPSDRGNYAIRQASENGHDKVVELLLKDPRVDPTVNDNWAIKEASKNGHLKVVKLLVQDERVRLTVNVSRIIGIA